MNRRARTFEDDLGSSKTGIGRWILPALLLSLLLHGLLWFWANHYPIERLSDQFYDRIVPRTFHLERAEIDPKLLDPAPAEEKRPAASPVAVKLPEEKVSFEKMMGDARPVPAAPKLDAAALADKPTVQNTSFESMMQTAEAFGAKSLLPDDKALTEQLLLDKPVATGATLADLPKPESLGGSAVAKSGSSSGKVPAGFSDLDDLLAQTGPLSPETAPILMPTDLLFDYNSAALRPQAVTSLEKLGELIRKNPNSRFLIEGHTDSFGSADYNLTLSNQRADSVKQFLVTTLGLPEQAIETRGYGSTRLIAPATGTIEEQQINRRVEIVIRAPATP